MKFLAVASKTDNLNNFKGYGPHKNHKVFQGIPNNLLFPIMELRYIPNVKKTMRRRHSIASLEVGTLRANVGAIAARTIQPPLFQQEINTFRVGITQKTIDTVKFTTECRSVAQYLV
ncbi:MAG: hypothetical protein J3Q66DRAFT_438266 [Benniella sp.]|nr:MAG: hypothetical protein J3Q66DRAFT_438266 [Benniella sp.]